MFAVAGKTALPPESHTRNLVPRWCWAGARAGGDPFPGWGRLREWGLVGLKQVAQSAPHSCSSLGVYPLEPGTGADGDLGPAELAAMCHRRFLVCGL